MAKRSNNWAQLLADERGTLQGEASTTFALGYPAHYGVAMSSLGFQTAYRLLNGVEGLCARRFFLNEDGSSPRPLFTFEKKRAVADAHGIGFSIACETELLGIVELLTGAGLAPLAEERSDADPPVVIGGPLVAIDPRLVAALADVVVVGEAEAALAMVGQTLVACPRKMDFLAALGDDEGAVAAGIWLPSLHGDPCPPARTPLDELPAFSASWSPHAEFSDMFLVELARGCARGCTFCVMSARAARGCKFRTVPVERLLQTIPADVPGVGLVGAAVTDHPEIDEVVRRLVESGKRVSLSSIRADRLTSRLARLLHDGGLRTLTVAADGSSERLRKQLHKDISADALVHAARTAAEVGLKGIKVYNMVGIPGETEADLLEFAELLREMASITRVSATVQAFVPKPSTPLAGEEMTPVSVVRDRLAVLKKHCQGRVRFSSTSPKLSWLDWRLVWSGERAGHVAIAAHGEGGSYAAWKKALKILD